MKKSLKPLSKSNYVTGLECPGHLWMIYHDKENIPEHSPGTLKRFEQGNIVGELAKQLFPEGIDIDAKDFIKTCRKPKSFFQKENLV